MKRKHVIIITAIIVISVVVSTWSIFAHQKKEHESPEEKLSSLFPSGDIYFYEQTNKPNTFAVGMVIENKSSLVFLWDNMNNRITEIEAAYAPLSEEYLTVYQQILTKNETSTWTGNRIVPCNLCRLSNDTSLNKTYPYPISNDTYYVYYYDGWTAHWYYGSAFFYLNNQTIVWDIHVT